MIPTIYLFCFSAVFTVYMKYKLAHFLETFDFNWNPRLMLPSIVFSQFVKILPWCHHDFLQWRAAWFYSGNQLNMSTKKLKSWKKLIFAMEHERLNILPVIFKCRYHEGALWVDWSLIAFAVTEMLLYIILSSRQKDGKWWSFTLHLRCFAASQALQTF